MQPLISWILCGLVWVAMAQAQEPVGFTPSPFRSLSKTRALLDAADLRVLLALGYQPQPESESLMARRPGVAEARVYARGGQRLEIAIAAGAAGGYDFVLYGEAAQVGEVRQRLEALVQRSRGSGQEPVEKGYQMYHLGHIEADRAMALLKALGYSSIEFEEKAASTTSDDLIFNLVAGKEYKLPLVVKVANASKTSLMAPDPRAAKMPTAMSSATKGIEGAPQLGGSHLHGVTSGEPQERLLLVYDRNDPEALERLINLLQSQIDVAAQQLVIEALVIEVNTSRLRDLGVELNASQEHLRGSFERSDRGLDLPFTFLFSRNAFADFLAFKGKLEALAESGNAKVLSSPSVLVLNDRQARIQVGQQIPVVRSTTTVSTTTSSVEYFPIGIVLNLRPRINPEGSEVTLQIETIISSISQSTSLSGASSSQVAIAPVVDNRQVETYVRVADGTPFIIGGLLSTDQQGRKVGLPLLSDIPILGSLLSRERIEQERREVIVVLTPHIVPLEDNSFSYLIPKDSQLFDRFDTQLFRNAYRVRDDEVWDLKFIQESPVLQGLVRRVRQACEEDLMLHQDERVRPLVEGRIPGEEVLVRRMLRDIVEKLEFGEEIDLDKVFFFVAPEDTSQQDTQVDRTLGEVLAPVLKTPGRALMLSYGVQTALRPGRAFTYPVAAVRDTALPPQEVGSFLRQANPVDGEGRPVQWTIVLASQEDVRHLQQVLILKRLLELNSKLPLTLQAFHPGLQILFPSREDMRARYHLIDREVAQLFYETAPNQYYPAFERNFNRAMQEVDKILGRRGN